MARGTAGLAPQSQRQPNGRPRSSKKGWLFRFLLRAMIFGVSLHYASLVWMLHGLSEESMLDSKYSLGFDLPSASDAHNILHYNLSSLWTASDPSSNQERQRLASKQSIRVLWAIPSTSRMADRRQILRDTYLSANQTNDHPWFCPFQNTTVAVSAACPFRYVFVISDSTSQADRSDTESDVYFWDRPKSGLPGWLSYVNGAALSHHASLDYVAWVNPTVLIQPDQIYNFLIQQHPSDVTEYLAVHTPTDPMPRHCSGTCAWDREAALRNGKFSIHSIGLVSRRLQEEVDACSQYGTALEVQEALWQCLVTSWNDITTASKVRIRTEMMGHAYTMVDPAAFTSQWQQHTQLVQSYQRFQRKHAVHYVTGKFHRDGPSRFASEFRDLETALYHWGLTQSKHLHLYNGDFPEFILQDPRWEQHVEFLKDPELVDLGAGYWFWKAALLEHHLTAAEEGDFVVFSNVGMWNHLPWLMELIETMSSRQANLAAYHNFFSENEWSKRDLYELLCGHKTERFLPNDRSNQYTGQFLVMRKSPGVMDFLGRYTRLASNYHLITDEVSVLPEYPEFREHRRDQSILSLLLKCTYQDAGKQLFSHPSIPELGWFDAFTFHLDPVAAMPTSPNPQKLK